jgi:hypothetical protein
MRKQVIKAAMVAAMAGCGAEQNPTALLDVNLGPEVSKLKFDFSTPTDVQLLAEDKAGLTHEIFPEYGGKLNVTPSGSIVWERELMESVVIGQLSDGNASICVGTYAEVCELSVAYKAADESNPGGSGIYSANLSLIEAPPAANIEPNDGLPSAVTDLNSLVLPSPNQEDAGSCLYMASTGAVEILLNKNPRTRDLRSEGNADLSERFLMNVGSTTRVENFLTDSVLLFNHKNGGVLNRNYRYTKGWYKKTQNGQSPASKGDKSASYGTKFNWINHLTSRIEEAKIGLPTVKRSIIYQDPENNQWNTGIMTPSVITKIKTHLATKKTPVLIVYNHFGYWHVANIVGYDDNKRHGGCEFANSFIKKMQNSPNQTANVAAIERAKRQYGCSTKGVFYVRDSIYRGDSKNLYDYDLSSVNDEAPYSKALVEHEYEWALYMGNHAYTVEF